MMREAFSPHKWVKPSTLAFWRAARERKNSGFWEALHGLIYLKWPEVYIGIGLGRTRFSRFMRGTLWRLGRTFGLWDEGSGARFADTYHGKVVPLPEAKRLIRLDRAMNVDVPEKVLPYGLARQIILENETALALLRCPCRATAASPCEPMDVCIIVGQPIVGFVLEHHPDKSRRVGVEEAVSVVEAAQSRGNVTHAFFKEAVLGRYYAICNCCSCCCGAMQAHREGTPMLASSGYLARVDAGLCVFCGKCVKVCPFSAISMADKGRKEKVPPHIDPGLCLGCGVCALQCPQKALQLELDPDKPAPLLVSELEHARNI